MFIIAQNHEIPQINYKQRSPCTPSEVKVRNLPARMYVRPFAERNLATNLFPPTSLVRENIKSSLSFIHSDSNRNTAFDPYETPIRQPRYSLFAEVYYASVNLQMGHGNVPSSSSSSEFIAYAPRRVQIQNF